MIHLKPSKIKGYYQISVLFFGVACLGYTFEYYSLLFLPVLIAMYLSYRQFCEIDTLYLSEPKWALRFHNGACHHFVLIRAWFSAGYIILIIRSNTLKKTRLIIFSDQLPIFQFKYLIFQVKKNLSV